MLCSRAMFEQIDVDGCGSPSRNHARGVFDSSVVPIDIGWMRDHVRERILKLQNLQ